MADAPEIQNEIHTSVPEHQVLLSFTDDVDAEAFEQWFNKCGSDDFMSWYEKQ